MSVVDFIDNYSFEVQNEVHKMHWQTYQILILVHICFRRNLTLDLHDEELWIFTK
jgi:hypothetical protein